MADEAGNGNEKGNNNKPSTHHPWDEVSLPGAGSSTGQQPTILEVINKANGEGIEILQATTTISGEAAAAATQIPLEATLESGSTFVNLVNSDTNNNNNKNKNKERLDGFEPKTQEATPTDYLQPQSQERARSIEIESHLIETLEEYPTREESVGIKELPPVANELSQGASRIETAENVRTVIEVEPVPPPTKKPVIQSVQPQHAHPAVEILVEDTATAKSASKVQEAANEEIRLTAERLVNEIEREVLEKLDKQFEILEHAKVASDLAAKQAEEAQITAHEAQTVSEAAETEAQAKTDKLIHQIIDAEDALSQKVDAQLSEVTSILKPPKSVTEAALQPHPARPQTLAVNEQVRGELKIVDVPSPKTPHEVEQRKLFIDSLPHYSASQTDADKLVSDCKREYYQSLKKYLVEGNPDKPPVPLQTYRWEDLKRAKERGGYPWTHLYKRPLGPDEEPEIVLLLRKSQELRFTSESPKSLKRVRIDEQVSIKETERYIQDLSADEDEENQEHEHDPDSHDEENHSLHSESISCAASDSVLAVSRPRKSQRFRKLRGLLRRRKSGRSHEDAQSLPGTSRDTSRHHSQEDLEATVQPDPSQVNGISPEHKKIRCFPTMKKIRSMADRQRKRLNIKRITLRKGDKIVLGEETKIMKLKSSPKAERSEIPRFIEKQDSDDVIEIVELDESPSRKRRDTDDDEHASTSADHATKSDEVMEVEQEKIENEECVANGNTDVDGEAAAPPKKAPRLRREHVYEEIQEKAPRVAETAPELNIIELSAVDALKKSLMKQDHIALDEVEANKAIPLDRMGSSEEEQVAAAAAAAETRNSSGLLAPMSSVDSTSSEEEQRIISKPQLSPVVEESEAGSIDNLLSEHATKQITQTREAAEEIEQRPALKKEPSPAPSDKKVTFSHVEDEAEPHREDIELPEEVLLATAAQKKWKNLR